MSTEELFDKIYVDKETQTDGAFFSGELRKFTAKEQVDRSIDNLSSCAIMKHTCSNYIIYDEVRTYMYRMW